MEGKPVVRDDATLSKVGQQQPATAHNSPQQSEPFTDTVADAAKFAGLSEWSIRDLVRQGKIEARRHGRRVLVIRASLRRYLDNLPVA